MKKVGEDIYIELLSAENATKEYAFWMNDPDVYQFLESRWKQVSISDLESYITSVNDGKNNFLFGVFDKKDARHVGNIKIGPVNHVHRHGDIGVIIGDKNYWGRGVATKAIALICEFAFNDLNLNKVIAGMYENNIGSYKAFVKNNFRKVGVFEKHAFLNGKYVDQIIMEKLKETV